MDWTMNDGLRALSLMQKRGSSRNFEDREIPADLLDEIIKTGLHAASGGNLQPVSIIKFTDKADKEKLMDYCGGQKFIGEAAVNLLFVLDWYKMGIFAAHEKAPYTCNKSYMHYLIGVEDVMCAAQTMETAAHLCGLGSCYVGTVNHVGDQLIEFCNLPENTYPVVMLCIGYPKEAPPVKAKLPSDIMVFDRAYPAMDKGFIVEKYREKYGEMSMSIPSGEPYRTEMLEKLRKSMGTTYTPQEVDEILDKAVAENKINETQRRFGLHYHAADMPNVGKEIINKMERNNLTPFGRN